MELLLLSNSTNYGGTMFSHAAESFSAVSDGLTIIREDMTDAEVSAAIILYELESGIPATDALTRPAGRLVDMVLGAFPALEPCPTLPPAARTPDRP
jgi:hypothetical protein